jgi:hypothetical protein
VISDLDVDAFWRDGYLVIRNAYTADEVAAMREEAIAHKESHKGDLLSHPTLSWVVSDRRMPDVARALLKRDDLVYYGDTSISIREGLGGGGWHKDNADRHDPEAPDWRSPYTQLRFGIYTQDHSEHSGGLNVRLGSHDVCDLSTGRVMYIDSRPGDLGVWSMRITHSANGVLLADAPGRNRTPGPIAAKKVDPALILPPAVAKRVVLFSALGARDAHYERYVRYLKTRAYAADQWRASKYTDEHIAAMRNVGVEVRDVGGELDGDPTVGINVGWKPIPY